MKRTFVTMEGLGEDPATSPIPVNVENAPPHWIFWLGALAAVGNFIVNATRKGK